jgi:Protein of unknown function, DUF538
MGSHAVTTAKKDIRASAEIIYGAENCYKYLSELVMAHGFPEGFMPLKNLDEASFVRETGFVWMKQKKPHEHYFRRANSMVRYNMEVTAYLEKGKMKKMTGVRAKELLLWMPVTEISVEEGDKIYVQTSLGIGRSFPASSFADEDTTKSVEAARSIDRSGVPLLIQL